MASNTDSERKDAESGAVKSPAARLTAEPGTYSEGKAMPDDVKLLGRVTIGFVLLWLMVLVALSWIGLRATASEVNRHFQRPIPTSTPAGTPTPAARPTASPTPSATPTATPTVAAAQVDTATQANASPTPTSTPSQQAATFAARQHFVTLAVVTATIVLFPWVLLLAFTIQRAPRLFRDLEKDLEALGLYRGPEKIRLDLVRELTKEIREGFKSEFREKQRPETLDRKASEYAKLLASMAVGRSSGLGEDPRELEESVWRDVRQKALEVNQRVAKEKENERGRIGLKQRFGWLEFLLPLLSMTPIVLLSFVWAFWPQATFGFVIKMVDSASLSDYFGEVVVEMSPAAVAVVTAYLFMIFGLVRRYHRSDITPGAYWEVLNRLIVVLLLGLVGSVLLVQAWDNGGTRTAAIALGILAGVFPVDTLRFFVKAALSRLRKWLAGNEAQVGEDLSKRLEKLHPLSLLDDLDPWDEVRLTEEGIIGIQGMATADITHLLIWTPFTTQQIVDWVDQSILFLAAGAEPDAQYVKTFRKMGLRGASDLIDATRTEADKNRVVSAAKAVQKAPTKDPQRDANEDPITAAQLAALDVQARVKVAQERVSQVKNKKKDDPLDMTTETMITSAVSGIQDARESIDSAVTRVKAGGETLAAALNAVNSLQAKFKTASEKAGDAESALASATDKINEDLAARLKALGEELTGDPDANSQAQALLDALDKIAKPLAQTEARAREFAEKAGAIQKKAESTQTDVPGEVGEAESLFNSLTALAQEAQKRIKADPAPADAVGSVDVLVKLLTDNSADKPKQLIGELKKKDEWTATGDGNKARSYGNAEKLVGQAAAILKQVQAAASVQALEDKPPSTLGMGACPPLTMELLVTLLNGLERNPNLRRIQRYLTSEVAEVPAVPYTSNNKWLGSPH